MMMAVIDRLIATVTVQWGWRRLTLAIVAGGLSALALAPLFLVPILFLTLPVLVWLIDGIVDPGPNAPGGWRAPLVAAFLTGWAFGFGFFLVGMYWIGFAFLVDADRYAWALPLVMAILPSGLALFVGAATALARIAWKPGVGRVLMLSVTWTLLEWLRGEVLTGFPWNRLGQAAGGSLELMQAAAYIGDLGLTFVLVFVAAMPATLADRIGELGLARRWAPSFIAVFVLAAIWGAGALRLAGADESQVPGVALRIVQPNIAQKDKWEPNLRSQTIARYLELSDVATSPDTMGIGSVTHLIWPETALPLLMEREPDIMAAVAALLPEQVHLITGALRTEPDATGTDRYFFNSVFVIRGDGTIAATYDKRRLVPFGEFLPLQRRLESIGLRQLTGIIGGFSPGTATNLLKAGQAPPFGALICYEIIFSGALIDQDLRPGWLINVTNDAWFGDSSGPHQHLAQARLRAVEQGLAVVRAANTGISAVIDPYGRVIRSIGYGQSGVIDASLPAPLEATWYAYCGDLPLVILLLVLFIGNIVFRSKYIVNFMSIGGGDVTIENYRMTRV